MVSETLFVICNLPVAVVNKKLSICTYVAKQIFQRIFATKALLENFMDFDVIKSK